MIDWLREFFMKVFTHKKVEILTFLLSQKLAELTWNAPTLQTMEKRQNVERKNTEAEDLVSDLVILMDHPGGYSSNDMDLFSKIVIHFPC